jgi:LCP family protein required for cell wall assembly
MPIQGIDSLEETQPIRVKRPRRSSGGLKTAVLIGILFGISCAIYLLLPIRSNILLLGIDRTPPGTVIGRSDSMILASIEPLEPYVGLLSIPRDLWVTLPGGGKNRINTAHFFAESAKAGTGPAAAMEVVNNNFGVNVNYYIRIQFSAIVDFVDALGGVPIELSYEKVNLPAGTHVLDGKQALTFVRNRIGIDDFFRMEHGKQFIKATMKKIMKPATWPRIPAGLAAAIKSIDTNVPYWEWPRLALALLRTGPEGIDARIISREMVNPFTTAQGAQVLAPNWEKINPLLLEMFGQ